MPSKAVRIYQGQKPPDSMWWEKCVQGAGFDASWLTSAQITQGLSKEASAVFLSGNDMAHIASCVKMLRDVAATQKRQFPILWICDSPEALLQANVLGMGVDGFCKSGEDTKVFVAHLQLSHRQIEQRAALERQFKEQNNRLNEMDIALKQREEFLSVCAHDLRSPLGLIQTSLSIVLGDKTVVGLGPQHRDLMIRSQRQAEHAIKLVNDLLDVMALEQGLKPQYQLLNLDAVTREFYEDFRLQAEQKGISFHYENPISDWRVLADAERVRQVLQNLFTNAVKFTDKGKNIYLNVNSFQGRRKTDPPYPMIIIGIRDEGKGIPATEIQKIFDKFTQIKDYNRSEGRGLGLTVAKQISTLHDGNLWVESEVGKGSTFFILIPHVISRLQPPQVPADKARIVIADSDEDRAKKYFEVIREWNYEPVYARDGVEAITLLYHYWPEAVVLSRGLKKIDTPDVCNLLRKDPMTLGLPLVVAGENSIQLEKSMDTSIIDGTLKLPFNKQVFEAAINTARRMKRRAA